MRFDEETSIQLEDFFKAYYLCRLRKRRTINALEFEVNYEENLVKLWRDVNSRKYEIGKSICFIVTKPKIREIFAADFRDRIVHHVIMMRLEPLFEEVFIDDNYNCRKGKGTLYGVKRLHEQIRECSENYTKNCYIGKFDMKGFFMSIHKPTLWKMLSEFIEEKYNGKDKDILLWLVKKIVMHCPQYKCIMKSPKTLWNRLPKNKSLFTCGDEFGLPIGNLTSQCFANFYLHWFDIMVKDEFGYYGRYVDDYYIIYPNKERIKQYVNIMGNYLKNNLKITLHPHKIYIQPYKNGVKFIGSIINGNRVYISNSTISNFYISLYRFNHNIHQRNIEHFIQTANSYWGFMKYCYSYNIKIRLFGLINPKWFTYTYYDNDKCKFSIKQLYCKKYIALKNSKTRYKLFQEYYSFA